MEEPIYLGLNSHFSMSTHIFLDLFQDYRRYFLVLGDVLLDSKTSKVILSILRSTRLSKTMLFSYVYCDFVNLKIY